MFLHFSFFLVSSFNHLIVSCPCSFPARCTLLFPFIPSHDVWLVRNRQWCRNGPVPTATGVSNNHPATRKRRHGRTLAPTSLRGKSGLDAIHPLSKPCALGRLLGYEDAHVAVFSCHHPFISSQSVGQFLRHRVSFQISLLQVGLSGTFIAVSTLPIDAFVPLRPSPASGIIFSSVLMVLAASFEVLRLCFVIVKPSSLSDSSSSS